MAGKIITITREYGSGGREIGEKLAKRLGLEFYDNKLIEVAAKDSGIHKNHFEESDERRTTSFLYLLSTTYGQGGVPFDDALYFAQLNAIRKIGERGNCLIIGRCADYALREYEGVLNLFIFAPFADRVKRAVEVYGIEPKIAESYVKRIDKQRIAYYNYYTDKRWGDLGGFSLCADSSALGIDGTADFLAEFAERYFK